MDWHSLYFQTEDRDGVIAALREVLHDLGYQDYDPFPGGSGTPIAFKTFVKLFVAPPAIPADGWIKVLGSLEIEAITTLSGRFPVSRAWLTEQDSGIENYDQGRITTPTPILNLQPHENSEDSQEHIGSLLPDDVQELAKKHHVNINQADKMLNRMTSQLFGKMDRASGGEAGTLQNQARALLGAAHGIDWNSPAARHLSVLAHVLPKNWRDPDFEAVREAYHAARMLKRNPNARLLPDEQAAIKVVSNALDYEAVYLGRA